LTLAAALLIQVGTNLWNDAADAAQGTDDPATRLGPPRAVAMGWLEAGSVRRAALAAFGAAFVLGVALAWLGGWPIVAIGLASIAAGILYSAGPRPIARSATGELFVLAFFGVAAVAGSAWLQGRVFTPEILVVGLLLGMPAAAVLVVNNTRDQGNDARSGRRTLAVRWGTRAMRRLYAGLVLVPFALLGVVQWRLPPGAFGILPWLLLPEALRLVRAFTGARSAGAWNALLAATARFQLGLGGALSLALWLRQATA
ncbi:MAG: 1,4-dihydroxy-2-naphthoate octaprenyltransferase, partial [Gammaproteobacteria bacterium]